MLVRRRLILVACTLLLGAGLVSCDKLRFTGLLFVGNNMPATKTFY